MATSTDVVAVRLQNYLNLPLVHRCREVAVLIEESSLTELQHLFPILIESLFGVSNNLGWGLHNLSLKRTPQEYETICSFLSPQGPLFSLIYKLLPDNYLKYNFPLNLLPVTIRSKLEEGLVSPFYADKIKEERAPTALSLNPFEYYIFHFAYHLTNPWLQLQQDDYVWVHWETAYVQLAYTYLTHFLPRDHSLVLPVIIPIVIKTPRNLMQSPEVKRVLTPRLLRSTVSPSGSLAPTSPTSQQQQCLPQVWRSETVVQVFLDFWLEYTEQEQLNTSLNASNLSSYPRRHSIFSAEHIRLVRAFIKTLHEFANSSVGDKSAMDELKRVILPSVQGKIYIFLRKAIHHWPLDSSFRLILEAWLSFIQPWRYVPQIGYTKEGKAEQEDRNKIHSESRWISFVANNLLAYTAIFQQLLPRFMRTDLVAPKNAMMLFRVTKVFSQPRLASMIAEVENCMDERNLSTGKQITSNLWSPIVRQQINELEGPNYQYIPVFSSMTLLQVVQFLSTIKQSHLTATSLVEALEKRRTGRKFFMMLWEFLNGEDGSSEDISIEERRRVPLYLATAQQQLIDIFQIKLEDIPQISIGADEEYHDSILSISLSNQSKLDTSRDSTRPGVYVHMQDKRQDCRYIEYLGDPELQPVRKYECSYLVRMFYKLSSRINEKHQDSISLVYERNDVIGRIARQVFIPPTTITQLPKRTEQGFYSGYEKSLPPRISLRFLANYRVIIGYFLGLLVAWLFRYSSFSFATFIIICWVINIIVRATCEPWIHPNSSSRSMRQ